MCGVFETNAQPSRCEVRRGLVGNLCRCTGYDSILAAAAHVDGSAMRSLGKLYPEGGIAYSLKRAAAESLAVHDGERTVFKPVTLKEAVWMRGAHKQATVLAGGTDLGVVWNKKKGRPADLICVGDLAELRVSVVAGGVWTVGAGVSLSDLEREAAERLPTYAAMLDRFGSPPIKNAGTLGGNLVNGSPIGDTIPALLVLNAEVELAGPKGSRRVNLNEFYTGYRKTVLKPDELLTAVHVPLPGDDEVPACYKISKRRDLDISSFTAAVWMKTDGDTIGAVRIAYGGVAPTVVRLPQTEAALVGQPLTEATWRKAGRIARSEIKPISDVRGSAEYRATLAANILVKFGREHGGARAAATNGHAG
jgi:xanthine dehydrogenase small subunit